MPGHHAPFETPEQHIGEIEARLKTCGDCGKVLIQQIDNGDGFDRLTEPAKKALFYISGYKRKLQSFAKWRADGKRMKKPCEKCGNNRWRTVIKGTKWKCRKCGNIREV